MYIITTSPFVFTIYQLKEFLLDMIEVDQSSKFVHISSSQKLSLKATALLTHLYQSTTLIYNHSYFVFSPSTMLLTLWKMSHLIWHSFFQKGLVDCTESQSRCTFSGGSPLQGQYFSLFTKRRQLPELSRTMFLVKYYAEAKSHLRVSQRCFSLLLIV